jgi:hypothetical protein
MSGTLISTAAHFLIPALLPAVIAALLLWDANVQRPAERA